MFRKFAATQILGAHVAEGHSPGLMRTAHRVEFNYTPRPGYLYVRSRMISSRCNDNFDEFPGDEIANGYLTFMGKPVFVNHHNENHMRARGVIVDAALHRDANRDGSPDTWVEGLQEIDALTFPKLARAIILGHIDRTSMGVDVEFSVCAVCHNKATTPLEYCRHIPAMKGSKILRTTASGERVNELVRERCHGLSFFENSLLVEEPADPTAYFLGSVERGPGLEHLGSHRPQTLGRVGVGPGLEHPVMTRTASRQSAPGPDRVKYAIQREADQASLGSLLKLTAAGPCPACASLNTVASRGDDQADCFDCDHSFSPTARLNAEDPMTPMAPLVPSKDPDEMEPHEKKAWNQQVKAHSDEWHRRNPMHSQNIVDHWHAATDEEKDAGKNWYPDAHHGTASIARDTNTPMHVAAGLVSNYSPQTHWATNIVSAAKVMRTKIAIGGKGNKDGVPTPDKKGNIVPRGILASASQKNKAHEMITNHTHYNDLLSGPKTRAFAHLIEHGGDSPEDRATGKSRVVVDRHALSVACGARASDAAYGHSGLSGKKKYAEAEGHYRDAARQISGHEGEDIQPHQVQATTWLVRQRLNEEHDRTLVGNGSRSAEAAKTAIHTMSQYMGEHHPSASIQMPGSGYSKRDQGATPLEKTALEDHAPGASGHTATGSRRGRH